MRIATSNTLYLWVLYSQMYVLQKLLSSFKIDLPPQQSKMKEEEEICPFSFKEKQKCLEKRQLY